MAERLTGIITHLVNLLEGKVAGLDRSIPRDRFELVEFNPEEAFPNASEAPYPFEIEDVGSFDPFEATYNTAGNDQYFGASQQIRIVYGLDVHDEHTQRQTVREDRRAIARCLTDSDSWDSAAGCVKAVWARGDVVPVEVFGDEVQE